MSLLKLSELQMKENSHSLTEFQRMAVATPIVQVRRQITLRMPSHLQQIPIRPKTPSHFQKFLNPYYESTTQYIYISFIHKDECAKRGVQVAA